MPEEKKIPYLRRTPRLFTYIETEDIIRNIRAGGNLDVISKKYRMKQKALCRSLVQSIPFPIPVNQICNAYGYSMAVNLPVTGRINHARITDDEWLQSNVASRLGGLVVGDYRFMTFQGKILVVPSDRYQAYVNGVTKTDSESERNETLTVSAFVSAYGKSKILYVHVIPSARSKLVMMTKPLTVGFVFSPNEDGTLSKLPFRIQSPLQDSFHGLFRAAFDII